MEKTLYSAINRKILSIKQINLVFGYDCQETDEYLNTIQKIFLGNDSKYNVDGRQVIKDEYLVLSISSNDVSNSAYKLSSHNYFRDYLNLIDKNENYDSLIEKLSSLSQSIISFYDDTFKNVLPNSSITIGKNNDINDLLLSNSVVNIECDSSFDSKMAPLKMALAIGKATKKQTILFLNNYVNSLTDEEILKVISFLKSQEAFVFLSLNRTLTFSCFDDLTSVISIRGQKVNQFIDIFKSTSSLLKRNDGKNSIEDYLLSDAYYESEIATNKKELRMKYGHFVNSEIQMLVARDPVITNIEVSDGIPIYYSSESERILYEKFMQFINE